MNGSYFEMLKRILNYAKKYYLSLVLAFIGAILYVSATLYAPKLVGEAIDKFVDSKNNICN